MTAATTQIADRAPCRAVQLALDLPHMDGDRLTGIVSNRDVRRLLAGDPPPASLSAPVSRIMSEGPVTVPPDASIAVAARLLLDERIGALPVRDGEAIVGIFTTADALDALLALVEGPRR